MRASGRGVGRNRRTNSFFTYRRAGVSRHERARPMHLPNSLRYIATGAFGEERGGILNGAPKTAGNHLGRALLHVRELLHGKQSIN